MAFSKLELKRLDRTVGELCQRHSPPEHADELRVVYRIDGHAVSIYEERPPWRGSGPWTSHGIARFRFSRARGTWTLFYQYNDNHSSQSGYGYQSNQTGFEISYRY